MNRTILIVDDEYAARYGMKRSLEKSGFTILEADSISSAEKLVEREKPQVVLLDVKLTAESGLDYLPTLVAKAFAPLVIIVTAHGSERLAVEAIQKGAYNYLAKPFDVDELRITVQNAAEAFALRQENRRLKERLAEAETFGDLIGKSPTMKRVYSLIEKVAQTRASVMITGESGTGKELVAREIHARSQEREGAFVAINCAAMPEQLIESELFGHEKGAFTGAGNRRLGKFEAAHQGTFFLDEIGDMSLVTQAKILRVIEERKFQRLGSNETLATDVRIISATNKNLEQEVAAQQFRADLYFRLCVVSIELPALRDRRDDIAYLAQSFCANYALLYKRKASAISSPALNLLLQYDWPGNVRQLKNCLERAVVLAEGEEITLKDLPQEILSKSKTQRTKESASSATDSLFALEFQEAKRAFERSYIERCLEQTSGNITQAAALLKMHRQSLQHKIKELGLTKKFIAQGE
ncbi:MAG: sigma-54-dependent Fis family transcriptional regulator [Acidobacteria bacterium]|nr:sigma-54-dependent Fis family transcriptional regulator [Acidobacteriota bacterium]